MPPKSSSGKEKDLTDEDDVLQAVILADSFNKRFKPLTVGKPRCLLPVCNATLLDWTFESLALAGVQEIFVICRSYPELVKAAIRDSKWSKPTHGLKIVPIITSKETFTPGDAMRDIYTRGIITSDFVLVQGDLVSNVRIDEVVRLHKERRRTNKDVIMTMVVKESGTVHRTRSLGESAVFVLDAQTSECLHYESVTGYPHKKVAQIPREIFQDHPEVEVRYDLIDCGIDVCSVEVPSLFQDNFDYGDIRRDFVHGVLTSDLLMKNIHCYVLKEGYAARVADTRSYDAVSKDILARWTFPLVPDDNHPGGHSYEHLRGNKYIAKGNSVSLSRTCKVGPNTLIGAGTTVSANASIHASVIGRNCTISENVILKNVYVFDGTVVGEGSVIEESIVGENVRIGKGSRIDRGCLVGDGVVLGVNARLGPFDRVSKRKEVGGGEESDEDGDGDEDEEGEDSELEDVEALQKDVSVMIGEGSNAIVWPQGPREDDEDFDEVERYNNQRLMRLGDNCSDLGADDDDYADYDSDSDSDNESTTSMGSNAHSIASSTTSYTDPSAAIHQLQEAAANTEFQFEVQQSLERAFAEGHSVDNAAVELKTLRMASNVELRKVREAVVKAIVEKIAVREEGGAAQRAEIAKVVKRWGALIDKIGGVDAVETVEVLQYHCAQSSRLPLFGQILAALYQDDIVEEDDIRAWHITAAAKGETLKEGTTLAENVKRCWAVGAKMIEQFDEQESSEEEEEEEKPAASKGAPKKDDEDGESEEEDGSEADGDSDDDDGDDGAAPLKAAASGQTPAAPKTVAKAKEPSEEDDSDSDDSEDEDNGHDPPVSASTSKASAPATAIPAPPSATAPAKKSEEGESSEEESGDEEESGEEDESGDEEEGSEEEEEEETRAVPTPVKQPPAATVPPAATPAAPVVAPTAAAAQREDTSSEGEDEEDDDDDDEEDSDEDEEDEPGPGSTTKDSKQPPPPPPPPPGPAVPSSSTAKPPPAPKAESSEEEEESEDEDDEDEEEKTGEGTKTQTATTASVPVVPAVSTSATAQPAVPVEAKTSLDPVTESESEEDESGSGEEGDEEEESGSDDDEDEEEDEEEEDSKPTSASQPQPRDVNASKETITPVAPAAAAAKSKTSRTPSVIVSSSEPSGSGSSDVYATTSGSEEDDAEDDDDEKAEGATLSASQPKPDTLGSSVGSSRGSSTYTNETFTSRHTEDTKDTDGKSKVSSILDDIPRTTVKG
ncbi:hypothetical protein BXZ70DRAFT_243863 [Cristinia sonorae]|uniref:Translation initiation factor eIF2B subunit epsilon n=1 Tax=Cristinia sonorae TaxID=1940300 RepID=A0A8K0UWR4_9AGAR|nr:hypothetical protein BXZ70DRAFT_243863 [Cristinia sonorae]